ncbi:MAG: TPM domain-containing protein [Fimbriimonadaceae bacterium]|nr:TPM domain-containing protein [Chitinophagales bacterium]
MLLTRCLRVCFMVLLSIAFTSCKSQNNNENIYPDYIIDDAKIFSIQLEDSLQKMIKEIDSLTSVQICVHSSLSTPHGLSVEDFALKYARELGIGQKYVNNGLLILYAMDQRHLQITTGYGIEWQLPDFILQPLTDSMAQLCKGMDFYGSTLYAIDFCKKYLKNVDWNISDAEIDNIKKDPSQYLGKIIKVKGKTNPANVSVANLDISFTPQTNLNRDTVAYYGTSTFVSNKKSYQFVFTKHMEDLLFYKEKTKDIYLRVANADPLVFQLIGIE